MEPVFFPTQAAWRKWLFTHHGQEKECLVGYWKKATGKPSVDWDQTVDEALCFGWIDGIRRSLGAESFTIRFTPRRKGSAWSAKNLKRISELEASGLLHEAGRAALLARKAGRTTFYSDGQAPEFTRELGAIFRKHKKAWKAWEAMAPSYRKVAAWWVESAKKEETRQRRLAILVEYSAEGKKVPPLQPKA